MSFPNTSPGTININAKGRAARVNFHDSMKENTRQKKKHDICARQSGICKQQQSIFITSITAWMLTKQFYSEFFLYLSANGIIKFVLILCFKDDAQVVGKHFIIFQQICIHQTDSKPTSKILEK
jgi:hypothetical protein